MSHLRSVFNRQAWFSNVYKDLLSGTVVALALIPEAIAFSIIAGVDPKVGIYASFCIATVIAFSGGRPAMISAATGAMALLMISLVRDNGELGLEYLFATTILTGVFQIVMGFLQLGNQMRFVPRAVMVGFVNALAILIFQAQLPQLLPGLGHGAAQAAEATAGPALQAPLGYSLGWVYFTVAAGLAIIYGLPRLVKALPSPLVAIVILTLVSLVANGEIPLFGADSGPLIPGFTIPTVGDMGTIPTTLPLFHWPQVPLNFQTLEIIAPYAFALALVGLMESFLTANVIDDFTDTASDKNQEAKGQGIANIVAGFFGGMAGCAMIGQSVINVRSGGRTRLSTLTAGVVLLLIILAGSNWVSQIPMAALVAVMIMVSISTFSWASLRNIRLIPKSETAVTLTTVLVTVWTHNLAIGVMTGVALSALFFSRKIADIIQVDSLRQDDSNHRTYCVSGDLFFVSVESFLSGLDYREALERVTLDLTQARIWDQTAVDAIDKAVFRFRKQGTEVAVVGLNEASAKLVERLATFNKPGASPQGGH